MSEIQTIIEIGRRNWWIILLTTGVALLASITISTMTEPTYQTSARFIVSPNLLEQDRDVINSLEALDKRSVVVTYAEVLRSNRVFGAAIKELNTPLDELVDYDITAVVLPEANVLELTVTGPDAGVAAALANEIGQEAIDYMSSLYPVHRFDFLDTAPEPSQPYAPQPIQNAILSVALGLGIGGALVFLRERLFTNNTHFFAQSNAPFEQIDQRLENQKDSPTNNFDTANKNGDNNDVKVTEAVAK